MDLVRNTNDRDGTVSKEELKLFIPLLEEMGVDQAMDKVTDRMAQFEKFAVKMDAFRGVLGDAGTKRLGEKRKAFEVEESQKKKKKGRLVMKNGRLMTAYD
jgi:hypothetical protein